MVKKVYSESLFTTTSKLVPLQDPSLMEIQESNEPYVQANAIFSKTGVGIAKT